MTGIAEAIAFPCGMYSKAEERANLATHACGLVLSITGTIFLFATMSEGQGWPRATACGIYTASLMVVYAMSTLSHGPFDAGWRTFFRSLDQGCIYFLIAGTCTPFSIAYLPGAVCWLLLGVMWSIAVVGFIAKVFLVHRIDAVSVWVYVLLGWMPILAAPWFIKSAPPDSLPWAVAGGLCYTLGTAFLIFDNRVSFFHAVWHLCVMSGSALHFVGILIYVAWMS